MIERYTLWEKPTRIRVVKVTPDSYQWLIANGNGDIVQNGNHLDVTTPTGVKEAYENDWVGLYDNGDHDVLTVADFPNWERRNDEEEQVS